MMGYLLIATLLVVPLIEIVLFILVGGQIGVLATLAAVLLTTLVGVALVRRQGTATLEKARREIDQRRVPAGALGEGLAIFLAGALLLIPGFFTDAIGFSLLVPPLRRFLMGPVAALVAPRLMVVTRASAGRGEHGRGPIIEGEAVEIDDKEPREPKADSPWRKP